MAAPPTPTQGDANARMPRALLELAQWVSWRREQRQRDTSRNTFETYWTKVPYNPRTGKKASVTASATWGTYQQARDAVNRYHHDGVGFVLTKSDPFCGIDLDHCRDAESGEIEPWALAIVAEMQSYTEVSPSGTGLRIFVMGALPPQHRRDGAIEMYDSERFLTVTGQQLYGIRGQIETRHEKLLALHERIFAKRQSQSRPTQQPGTRQSADNVTNLDDVAVLESARNDPRNGATFTRLWAGDSSGYTSQSEADLALVNELAYWIGPDAERIDRLFRRSGLMRPKWERSDYSAKTIQRVLSTKRDFYTDPKVTPLRPPSQQRQRVPAQQRPDSEAAPPPTDGSSALKPQPAPVVEETHAQTLFRLAENALLFHTSAGQPYARAAVNGHLEVWGIGERGSGFRRWLVHQFYAERKTAPNATALTQAMEVLGAKATIDGEIHNVYTRVAPHDGAIYLDLGSPTWECVEMTRDGWRIITEPPVFFRRPNGMLALPTPVKGGSIDELRPFINIESESDWMLVVSWLVGALHPTGPYPILALHGERGSAKSNATRFLRRVLDTAEAPTRDAPKEPRDLAIAAHNNWVLALDNLSHMPAWLSDALCRLATGSGFATRALYSDDAEIVFHARRPCVFNGIEELATRGDLLDRAMVVTLPTITDGKRKTEGALDDAFTTAHPRILGALLDAVVSALRYLPTVALEDPPRMADFAHWILAAERGLGWPGGQWLAAYRANRDAATSMALDASPVASAVLHLMETHMRWEGTTEELLKRLNGVMDDDITSGPGWPKSARPLGGMLRRLAPDLRPRGIEITQQHKMVGNWVAIVATESKQG